MSAGSRQLVNLPIAATAGYLAIVEAAGYRCECTGKCGAKHKTSRFDEFPDRCEESMVNQMRPAKLYVWPADLAGEPPLPFALCAGCWDGFNRIKKRAKRARLIKPQTETIFDVLNESPED